MGLSREVKSEKKDPPFAAQRMGHPPACQAPIGRLVFPGVVGQLFRTVNGPERFLVAGLLGMTVGCDKYDWVR